jgi:hypothetical protein
MKGHTGRGDHEVVRVGNRLVPVLGTVGGTPEQSRETANNIENYFSRKPKARPPSSRPLACGCQPKEKVVGETACIFCGCTDKRACAGGCYWLDIHPSTPTGICSACGGKAMAVFGGLFARMCLEPNIGLPRHDGIHKKVVATLSMFKNVIEEAL